MTAFAFHPDGQFLATGSEYGEVVLWPLPGGVPQRVTGRPGVRELGFLGEYVYWDDGSGATWRWPVVGGPIEEVSPADRPPVWYGAEFRVGRYTLDPRGRYIAGSDANGQVWLWHAPIANATEARDKLAALSGMSNAAGRSLPGHGLRRTLAVSHGWAAFDLAYVPAGELTLPCRRGAMGCEGGEPNRRLASSGIWMGVTEVTQAQYAAVMGESPSPFHDPDLPVSGMSWADVHEFCERLSFMTGMRVRPPTWSEWEYAARGGAEHQYLWGDDVAEVCEYGNVLGLESSDEDVEAFPCRDGAYLMAPVGQYRANAFGVRDMVGNVAEMVVTPDALQRRPKYSDTDSVWLDRYTYAVGGWAGDDLGALPGRQYSSMATDIGDGKVGFRIVVEASPPADGGAAAEGGEQPRAVVAPLSAPIAAPSAVTDEIALTPWTTLQSGPRSERIIEVAALEPGQPVRLSYTVDSEERWMRSLFVYLDGRRIVGKLVRRRDAAVIDLSAYITEPGRYRLVFDIGIAREDAPWRWRAALHGVTGRERAPE